MSSFDDGRARSEVVLVAATAGIVGGSLIQEVFLHFTQGLARRNPVAQLFALAILVGAVMLYFYIEKIQHAYELETAYQSLVKVLPTGVGWKMSCRAGDLKAIVTRSNAKTTFPPAHCNSRIGVSIQMDPEPEFGRQDSIITVRFYDAMGSQVGYMNDANDYRFDVDDDEVDAARTVSAGVAASLRLGGLNHRRHLTHVH